MLLELCNLCESAECECREIVLEKLAAISHRRELLELEELSDVRVARATGATWAEIGTALRVGDRIVSKKYGLLLRSPIRS
jgi:hypothetical protein